MKLGMTGTQRGMTEQQLARFGELLFSFKDVSEFHHGDCVGADAQARECLDWMDDSLTYSHPPENPNKRAFTKNDYTMPEKPYLVRNKDIVDASDVLVVLPGERTEQLRSGTWSTYRYAKKQGKVCFVIYP